ncbi:hypothetical protein FM037_08005 [Shewanella psychropiezotolerans]|uniref:Uncharacterized protein n=1 Tax=Shewanella psychropiezotolerans TaxID=2593655 RepID=A0ABX5WWK2_9GAMM|nr:MULTISPECIES: hypothetical protein [Shewanella]MPY22509.1 hypothetical protein [Shewanella sp. YLB-07]QDO83176.1 hypothetical protein FM037_08005 [Shewanella psychropiezotolerans]
MTSVSSRVIPLNFSKEHAGSIESGAKEKTKPKPKGKADIKLRAIRHNIEVRMELRALSSALDLEEREIISLLSHDYE